MREVREEFLALRSRGEGAAPVGGGASGSSLQRPSSKAPPHPEEAGVQQQEAVLTRSLLHKQVKWDKGFSDKTKGNKEGASAS